MKRFFIITLMVFAALFFVISCGGGSSKTNNNTDTGETVTDEDTADTDEPAGDTGDGGDTSSDTGDSTDTTPDSGDSESEDDPTGSTDDDNADSTTQPDENGEAYETSDDEADDDTNSTSDEDADTIPEPTENEKCTEAGGTYNEDGTCTKNCEPIPATVEHADWNGTSTYIATYSGGEWSSITTEYSETAGECNYGCSPTYFWTGSNCVNPCDADPCENVENSTKVCTATDATTYSCGCEENYVWNVSECIPECNVATTKFPCYDSSTTYIWSKRYDSMKWQAAVDKCTGLNSSNYGGYSSGWHLPTISELRTLIQNCSGTQMPGGTCGVREDEERVCLSSSCQGEDCYSCSSDSTGGHSKFGDTDWLWSYSIQSDDSSLAWVVNFDYGLVYYYGIGGYYGNVRCVR